MKAKSHCRSRKLKKYYRKKRLRKLRRKATKAKKPPIMAAYKQKKITSFFLYTTRRKFATTTYQQQHFQKKSLYLPKKSNFKKNHRLLKKKKFDASYIKRIKMEKKDLISMLLIKNHFYRSRRSLKKRYLRCRKFDFLIFKRRSWLRRRRLFSISFFNR